MSGGIIRDFQLKLLSYKSLAALDIFSSDAARLFTQANSMIFQQLSRSPSRFD
jgi:hypothetical protein